MTAYDDALDKQILARRRDGGPVVLTPGTITRPHVVDGCDVVGGGTGCVVSVAPGLSGAALTLRNTWADNRRPAAGGFLLHGPGRLALGLRTAGCDGLRVECQAYADNVRVEYFDGGFVWASPAGHVRLTRCTATRNYYNVFCAVQAGDYSVTDSYLDGAAMACLAMPCGVGVEGLSVERAHGGYAPYVIYQESAPMGVAPSRFLLQDARLLQFRAECVGNGYLYSAFRGQDGGPRQELRDVTIDQPGFSWSDDWRLAGVPRDYALCGDLITGGFDVRGGSHPILAGDRGVYGFARVNGVSGDPQQVGAGIRLDGQTPTAMP